MLNNRKFCPKCGTANNATDAYCVKCRYDFRNKGRKSSGKFILILILLLLVAWVVYRVFTKESIIPTELLNLIKNMTSNK